MKTLSENRRARFDYEITETYEAGIELLGTEVKSVKQGRVNISGSYALIRNDEAWLVNADIPAYQPKNAPADYNATRARKLLLNRAEIKNLAGKLHEKGLALLPLNIHIKRGLVKIELGLGRSRKKGDKRELLKKRATEREMRRFE